MTDNPRDRLSGVNLFARVLRGGIGGGAVQATALAATLGLTVCLARGLDATGFGIYAYAAAVLNLLLVVSEAGVPSLMMREIAASQAVGDWRLLRGALVRGLQVVLAVSVALAMTGIGILTALSGRFGPDAFWTAIAMLAALPFAVLAKTLAHAVRGLHHVVWAQAAELLLRPLFVLVLVAILLVLSPGLLTPYSAMAAQVFAAGLVVMIAGWRLWRALPPDVKSVATSEARSRWLRNLAPFALIGGAMIINTQADIIMLGWFRPASEVGAYKIAAQASFLTMFVIQASQNVLSPIFAGMYGENDFSGLRYFFRKISLGIFVFTLPIAIVLIFLGEPLVSFVFGRDYAVAAVPLAVLAAGYLVNIGCGPVGALLQMVGRERVTAQVLAFTVAMNLVLNAALIPIYGMLGGAFATAASVIVYHAALRSVAYRQLGV